MGLPLRLGLETLGVGGAPPDLGGGEFPPLGRRPHRWDPKAGAPPGGLYKGGEGGLLYPSPWRLPLPPVTPLSPACAPCRDPRYFHHHAVVLLDLHQPLLPPCWIKKEETSLLRTCVERGGAVRSALGHR